MDQEAIRVIPLKLTRLVENHRRVAAMLYRNCQDGSKIPQADAEMLRNFGLMERDDVPPEVRTVVLAFLEMKSGLVCRRNFNKEDSGTVVLIRRSRTALVFFLLGSFSLRLLNLLS